MIAGILSILGSSTIGSLLGGIFAWLNRKADIAAKALELAHEKDKWAHDAAMKAADLEYAKQEAQAKKDVAIIETDGSIEVARMSAIAAAQAADKVDAAEITAAGKLGWLLVIASAVTKLVRPCATVILTTAALYLNYLLIDRLVHNWPALTTTQQYEAAMQAFAWITGQGSAVLGYWFVARGSSKS
jgi:hypothetical protein